jgi:hypothetical protein
VASREDTCKTGVPVDVTATVVRQPRTTTSASRLALRGVEVVPGRSRMLDRTKVKGPPASGPVEQILMAADLAGDGTANLLATMRPCEDVRRATPGVAGRNGHSFCVTFWKRSRAGAAWTPANQVDLHLCQ